MPWWAPYLAGALIAVVVCELLFPMIRPLFGWRPIIRYKESAPGQVSWLSNRKLVSDITDRTDTYEWGTMFTIVKLRCGCELTMRYPGVREWRVGDRVEHRCWRGWP